MWGRRLSFALAGDGLRERYLANPAHVGMRVGCPFVTEVGQVPFKVRFTDGGGDHQIRGGAQLAFLAAIADRPLVAPEDGDVATEDVEDQSLVSHSDDVRVGLRHRHEAREFLEPGLKDATAHDRLPRDKPLSFIRFRELTHTLASAARRRFDSLDRDQPLQLFKPVLDEDRG